LIDWTTHSNPGIKYYAGTATYRKALHMPALTGRKVLLDLGTCHRLAEVTVNGKKLGVLWTAPWHIGLRLIRSPDLPDKRHAYQSNILLQCTTRRVYDLPMISLFPKGTFRFFLRLMSISAGLPLLLSTPSIFAEAPRASHVSSHLAAPSDLRCTGLTEPLAVADARPEFSWKVQAASSALHAVLQSSYEIRIGTSSQRLIAGKSLLWDSGKVDSSATSTEGKAYTGPALQPQHAYAWQVRVWDEKNNTSTWSRPAHWTQAPEWEAKWIAAHATDAEAGKDPMPLLRKKISVPGPVARALLYTAGLGQYEFRINGAKVGNSELTPGWSDYRKTVFYDSYDVTSMLRSGANALGIMLGNGMYRVPETPGRYNKFTGSYGPPKCIVQLHIELTNRESIDVISDGSWKTKPGPITFSSTYGGEDYDARRDIAGWDGASFDDAAWTPVSVAEGPGGMLRPELAPPIRVMRTYTSILRTEPKPGILVYDLGQNFAGWPAITVNGPAGATVKLIPGELLNPDGTVSQQSSGEPQWYSYTLKGAGTEQWHPRFSYYGFRYVQVEGSATAAHAQPELPKIITLRGEAVHTSSESVGTFESSDKLLNRIHELIVRAIENNAESLLTDCPHREKLGWLEETHLLAPSLLYDFELSGIYAATARNIADAQQVDGPKAGRVPEIAPQYVVFEPNWGIFDDSPEWGSAAVLAPWYVYERDGDMGHLLSHLEVMRGYVDYLSTRAHEGIISYGLGDWYDIGPGEPGVSKLTSPGFTPTAIYYQDLRVLQRTLAMAGKNDESRSYAEMADAVRHDFNARFYDAAKQRYDKGSQTAQAMPLTLGMVPEGEQAHVLDALIADIRAHQNHVTAGDVGYHYVVDALLQGGRSDVLYDMLERTDSPSYGYQLAQGATSLTEAWDANPHSSQDHFMLGDVEEWFYRGLAGINVDFAAQPTSQLMLRPEVVGNLSWVRGRYVSAWGPVESYWRRGASQTDYEFTIPANATATVELKSASPDRVRVDGLAPDKTPGVLSSKASGDTVKLVIGSGHYRISAPNAAGKLP
jgi:alpha-L-rhamnosidase